MTDPYWTDGDVTIWHADARTLPLDDESVDLIVTSPPYFGLRSYTDGGEHYDGQIGDEPTPSEFVDALLDVTRECARVLKPSGSIWVNLGDKYAGSTNGTGAHRALSRLGGGQARTVAGASAKSLIGIPWRYALRCIDDLGLILRAEVIWSKPNGLPESVTDRVRRSHETWFHFTKQPRYFSAVDDVREPHVTDPRVLARLTSIHSDNDGHSVRDRVGEGRHKMGQEHPLGKLPGSVWEIPTQPLRVPAELGIDHFAAFPMEWPRRIIRGWSPSGICLKCGEGRRPVAKQTDEAYAAERARVRESKRRTTREQALGETFGGAGGRTNTAGHSNISNGVVRPAYAITGEACACDAPTAPTRPAVVLDPFGGTGTTALAARALGRRAHLVDLSRDYCRLAQWRVNDPAERARAMRVDKPPAAPVGVPSLFDILDDVLDEDVTG